MFYVKKVTLGLKVTNTVFYFADKPIFIQEPTDVEVSLGNTARFTCIAQGSPTPEILWMKNKYDLFRRQRDN